MIFGFGSGICFTQRGVIIRPVPDEAVPAREPAIGPVGFQALKAVSSVRQCQGDTQIYGLTRHPVLRGPFKRKLPLAGALTPRSQSAPAKGNGMPVVMVSFPVVMVSF